MHTTNMRPKEDWMRKGAPVTKSGLKGTLTQFAESKLPTGQVYVHTMYVKLQGTDKPAPFNPNDIDPAQ